jgi:subtilisin family serine protease
VAVVPVSQFRLNRTRVPVSRFRLNRTVAPALLLAAASALAAGPGTSVETADTPGTERLIVRLADGARLAPLLHGPLGREVAVVEIVTHAPLRAVLRVRSGAAGDARRLAAQWSHAAGVDYATAERFWPMELRGRHEPDDPLFPQQWPLDNRGKAGDSRADPAGGDVDAPEAWSYTLGSPEVLIAVLDDGIELTHPDLAPNVAAAGMDFTVNPPVPGAQPRDDADRHGTAVAGVLAARGDNGIGVSGICPRCRILPIRVHGSSNLGTAAAFRYAVQQGADVITNSWGYTRAVASRDGAADDAVRDAIESAARDGREGRGTLVVFGMTNDSVDNCTAPTADISSLASVLAVGVANHDDEVGGAGFGACIDLVAPAKPMDRSTIGVVTTDRSGLPGHTADDYYAGFGGTSAAAPLVAGVAGLLLSLNPKLTRDELQRILEHTADKIDPAGANYDAAGFSERAGYGRVNAARALAPTVKITASATHVAAGEPFSVTVTASAPYGLESVWWTIGEGAGEAGRAGATHRRELAGEHIESVTWSQVVLESPGTHTLVADARDVRYADNESVYPHRAGERAPPPSIQLTVVERPNAVSR